MMLKKEIQFCWCVFALLEIGEPDIIIPKRRLPCKTPFSLYEIFVWLLWKFQFYQIDKSYDIVCNIMTKNSKSLNWYQSQVVCYKIIFFSCNWICVGDNTNILIIRSLKMMTFLQVWWYRNETRMQHFLRKCLTYLKIGMLFSSTLKKLK